MIIVSVDFESWAICDIKLGSWAYILHPETRILMMSWYVIGEPKHMAELWWPGQPFPPRLAHLIACGCWLQGWKAMDFERLMWHYKAVEQHGFPRIENHRWLDTMHRAAASNMPRSLDGAAKFVGSSSQKDMVGHKLMLELTNGKRTPFPLGRPEYYEKLTKLGSYCVGDSLTEADVGEQPMLAPWPTVHPWGPMPQVDRAINDRGILLDLPLIRGLANAAALEKERMDERINEITDKKVPKTTNVEGLKRWLVEHGVDLPRKEEPPPDDDEIDHVPSDADPDDVNYDGSVLKTTKYLLRKSDMVDLLLRDDLPDKVKEAIQLRAWAAKASIGKLQTMLGSVCADGRIRGALTLMGAQQTGRFSSTLVQVHNMPRNPLPDMDKIGKLFGLNDKIKDHRPMLKELSGVYLDMAVRDGTVGDHNQIREHWGPVMDFASKMLRRVIFAPEGHVLLQTDFAQIEARLAAWLAGQQNIVDAFARGEDVYTVQANLMGQSRQIGKVACIAEGEMVLTDHGLKPIERVALSDKVWDGMEWVEHGGAVCVGVKEVIFHDGLWATPDHKVWDCAGNKLEFGVCRDEEKALARTGDGWSPLRFGGSNIAGRSAGSIGDVPERRAEILQKISLPLHGLPERNIYSRRQSAKRKKQRMSVVFNDSEKNARAVAWLPTVVMEARGSTARPVPQPKTRKLQALRRTGYRISLPDRRSRCDVCFAVLENPTKGRADRLGYRQNQYRRALRAGQHPVCDEAGQRQQPQANAFYDGARRARASDGRHAPCAASLARLAVSRWVSLLSAKTARDGGTSRCAYDEKHHKPVHKETWDILNAGPRHRFTVSGRLVSNCLALNYQGGPNAFAQMAVAYSVRIRAVDAKPIVMAYRAVNPCIVAFWAALMDAALNALDHKGYEFPVAPLGVLSFRYDGEALRMRLPSGRDLTYWKPYLSVNKWGRREINFIRVKGKATFYAKLYGGLALENACQAICTDCLCDGLVEMERQQMPVVLHIHDSAAAECREDDVDRLLPLFEEAMIISSTRSWSRGLPIAGDTKISRRLS